MDEDREDTEEVDDEYEDITGEEFFNLGDDCTIGVEVVVIVVAFVCLRYKREKKNKVEKKNWNEKNTKKLTSFYLNLNVV